MEPGCLITSPERALPRGLAWAWVATRTRTTSHGARTNLALLHWQAEGRIPNLLELFSCLFFSEAGYIPARPGRFRILFLH